MVLFSRLGGFEAAPGPAQSDRITAPSGVGATKMPLPLPAATGAIIAAQTKHPATATRRESRGLAAPMSALRLTGHCRQLLSRVILSLLLQVSILASGLLHLSQSASIQTFHATIRTAHHSIRVSKQATWALWDGPHGRRLRKKIEFEFFTLILGSGGNNLCLVIFWPGWGVLAFTAFMFSTWYAG
ncbi:hypothetical protein GGS24DRAFT_322422 [Hypoxylon argillaceum]|nr:hypothetical protein GGS24DRAFT_322422 [Hypoxylon argillaceum]